MSYLFLSCTEVYFKNFYISPSYNFDLGDNTDLSVIASYQHREYIRQQGLPVIGTLKDNPNGPIDRSLYIGDPNFGKYEADVYRTGYTFKHTFDNGWNFNQNFAVQKPKWMAKQSLLVQVVTFGQKINKVKLIIRLSAVEITADTKLLIT